MNSIQRAFAFSLLGVTMVTEGCRSSTPPSSSKVESLEVALETVKSLEIKPSDEPKPLIINTSPVFFKIEDNGLVKLGILKENQIKIALREAGVKEEHVGIFTANIQERFAYYQDLFTKGEVHVKKLKYVEDLDLSNVELILSPGEDFDLGMGFPGEVDTRPTSDLHIDLESLLVTNEGIFFEYRMGDGEEVKEGLVRSKFGRPILLYYGDKKIIVIDPTKGLIIEKKQERNAQEGARVAGVCNSARARIFSL